MNGDKAPGPDGFTVAFWQFSWDIVKEEIMLLFNELYENAKFVRNLNATFIVFVPKTGGAEDIRDYKLISLVNSIYKLMAKVLAKGLQKVMDKLANVAQNAFMAGRQILDASLIANEVVDSLLKKKEKSVLCKLDIEKSVLSVWLQFER